MKKWREPVILIVCLSLCVSLFAACGGTTGEDAASSADPPSSGPSNSGDTLDPPPETSEDVKYADHLEYVIADAVGIINSHSLAGDGSSHNNACRMIYDTLYYNQPDGTSTPMLATSYETTDYQTWIFHLRDDVSFHNGDKFTAKDVVFTWKHALESTGSIAANNWNYISSATAIDDYTVEFKTAAPYGGLLFNVGISVSGILNERAIEEDPIEGFWIGTGAYKIAEFSTNDYIKFERNEDYWGELPLTKTQTWRLVSEASSRTVMLQNGAAQIGGVPEADLALFEGDDNYSIHTLIANNSMSLMFNFDDPICGDLNFRRAVAHAINKEEIALFVMGSLAAPVEDGTIWGYEVPFKNNSIQPINQDIEKAKEFLAASSYKGQALELSIMSGGDVLATALQEQLNMIGVNVEINVMDVPSFMVYTAPTDNKAQLLTFFCMMSQNPVDTYRVNFYPLASNNKMNYDNPEITRMLDEAQSVLGEDAQRDYFYRMQEIVSEEIPAVPLYWMAGAMVYAKGVGGIVTSASAHYDFRYLYMIVE
jgi:peptide/nickel transport system substrate-binding protein